VDVEFGLDIGIAPPGFDDPSITGTRPTYWFAQAGSPTAQAHHGTLVFIDDVSMLAGAGDVLLRLRSLALELYATTCR